MTLEQTSHEVTVWYDGDCPLCRREIAWLRRLDRPSVEAVLLWRWFTDPARGGAADTDYTPQGKQAEGVLLHAWLAR